ncbi:MAG: aminoglycoside phosphotransferase family protein [Oscillospiraceae bacterium]|nr:aminoglycoside phosphotransferase family protein [Oscillospiraceae bacterium]
MSNYYFPENEAHLRQVMEAFSFPATLVGAVRYGCGHINDTFCVLCQPKEGDCIRFILQGLSQAAFPRQDEVMENFERVTDYLREQIKAQGGDPARETLSLLPTKDGNHYYTDENGKVWRLMPFIEGTECYQTATPERFAASASAFGRFQYLLRDFPAHLLHEPIARFHDTENRFEKLLAAVEADKAGRKTSVQAEIDFALARQEDCSVALNALRAGVLPLRVTHNDTKLNNVLIDRATGRGLCVVDLDTVMPGLVINDFGDSIRFGANHAAEDEKDLSKVNFDISLYEIYARSFIQGTQGGLTQAELEYLPWGARLMTFECGIRFLTDYLDGDVYFHTTYPEHNLDRCRTQFKLVRDMEEQFDKMRKIIRNIQNAGGNEP